MIFNPADLVSVSVFSIFSSLMLVILLFAFSKAGVSIKIRIGFLIYLFVFSLFVISGLPQRQMMPVAPLLFFSVPCVFLFLGLSTTGLKIAQSFSFAVLIGFQSFRLPLELILHHWANIDTIPVTMTWTGQNWDVITGIVSFFGFFAVKKYPQLIRLINLLGFLLLLNVIRVAFMSLPLPLPFAWSLANPLQLIMYFPYALIGPLFVGPALLGHILVFRKNTLVSGSSGNTMKELLNI